MVARNLIIPMVLKPKFPNLKKGSNCMSVAMKCNFCQGRIDTAKETGQTPGVDPEVTPACVNSCIAEALHFGDRDDPNSNVSKLLAENQTEERLIQTGLSQYQPIVVGYDAPAEARLPGNRVCDR